MAKGKGLSIKLNLSEDMEEFMGKSMASRTEITKAIWDYIKSEGLQDEDDGRIIHPDDVLEPILGKKSIKMTEIARKISAHVE